MKLSNSIKIILKKINPDLFIKNESIIYIQDIIGDFVKEIIRISDIIVIEHQIKFVNEFTLETTYSIITKSNIVNGLRQKGIENCKNSIDNFLNFCNYVA